MWKYDKFHLENTDEAQCKIEFHILCSHIYVLRNVLNIPEKIVNIVSSGENSKFWS